jgi:hypothetical protein
LPYDALREEHGPKRGAREYLGILLLAARCGEDRVERAIRFLLGSRQGLNKERAAQLIEENIPVELNAITIDPVCLSIFDELLTREDPAA